MCRDSTWSVRGWPHDAALSCRTCGNRVYGQAAVDHTDLEWDKHQAEEAQRATERLKRTKQQRKLEAERLLEVEAERLRLKEAECKVIQFPEPQKQGCAWGECLLPRREKSIYCSRDCSNKNARARHAARQ